MKYAVVIIALIAVLLCLFIYIKIKNCILRVKSMSKTNKIRKINELAEPFGFYYIEREDIFSSRKRRCGRERWDMIFHMIMPRLCLIW